MSNTYFLIITLIDWQIHKKLPSMVFPLTFVIFISMIKDIFEDLKRHASDKKENMKKVLVGDYEKGIFEERLWQTLTVGSIVKIKRDEAFPADLIILNSSLPKGLCYIETKDLDGETNLKHKQAPKRLLDLDMSSDEALLKNFKGTYI